MRKRSVSLGPDGFRIDGNEYALIAAQIEPFRQNSLAWRPSLEAIKGAGIDLVSIFICWDFHEISPGEFDFTGRTNPSRDLQGFLELCADLDLSVLARPGPVIDAEWETRGPARDVMHLDRLHPRFIERSGQYINAVCEILAPQQATRGGPIVLVGVDNEILYPYNTPEYQYAVDGDVYVPYDEEYNAAEFKHWIRGQYANLEVLNKTLGTRISSWDDISTPRYQEDARGYSQETFRFINHRVLKFAALCQAMYKGAGIEVPTYTNMKQLLAYIDWVQVAQELDSVGINLHMPRNMPGNQALTANWWYRLHRARFPFMWAAEFQSGWISLDDDFGFISEEHSEYMPMAAQAAGLRGLNFYMFVERDDWNYSPVNLAGKIRPGRYERFRRVVASYRGLRQIDQHIADVGLLWSLEDHQSIYIDQDRDWTTLPDHWLRVDEAKEAPAWWNTFKKLTDEDVDFRFWIPGVSQGAPPRILIHAGLATCTKNYIEALAALSAAGHVIIAVAPLPKRNLTGMHDQAIRSAAEAVEAAREFCICGTDNLVITLASLGSRSFVRSGMRGVWTYAYRDNEDSIILGIWNSTNAWYPGPVSFNGMIFAENQSWQVKEPRTGQVWNLAQPELREFPATLEPFSARVYRFSPARPRETASIDRNQQFAGAEDRA
jgi:hypothetical protein